jgi:hypothetical protein
MPLGITHVRWVATTNGEIVPQGRLTAFSDPDVRSARRVELGPMFAGSPRSLWYLPPGFEFLRAGEALALAGTGKPAGNLYAHSANIPVRTGAHYNLEVAIDASHARGRPPCFYIAELPSGKGISMLCARNGRTGSYAVHGIVPAGIQWIQLVAFSNNTTIDDGKAVIFSRPSLRFVNAHDVVNRNQSPVRRASAALAVHAFHPCAAHPHGDRDRGSSNLSVVRPEEGADWARRCCVPLHSSPGGLAGSSESPSSLVSWRCD